MVAIMIPDISEIQVPFPFLMNSAEKGVVSMRKNEKFLHRIIHQLVLVIFILLAIIVLK